MAEVEEYAWPRLLPAETRTAQENRKQAIQCLRKAVKSGLENPETLEKNWNLEPLRAEVKFQKMVEQLKSK